VAEPVHFLAPALVNVAYEFGEALSLSDRREAGVGHVLVVLVKEHLAMRGRLVELDPHWHPHRLTLDELTAWREYAATPDGSVPDAWPRYDPDPTDGRA
jgi:hypothetical protein